MKRILLLLLVSAPLLAIEFDWIYLSETDLLFIRKGLRSLDENTSYTESKFIIKCGKGSCHISCEADPYFETVNRPPGYPKKLCLIGLRELHVNTYLELIAAAKKDKKSHQDPLKIATCDQKGCTLNAGKH